MLPVIDFRSIVALNSAQSTLPQKWGLKYFSLIQVNKTKNITKIWGQEQNHLVCSKKVGSWEKIKKCNCNFKINIIDHFLFIDHNLPSVDWDFFPKKLSHTPLLDPDPYYRDKSTFITVSSQLYIDRYSSKKSLFLFSPSNFARKWSVKLVTHLVFNCFISIVILAHCYFLILKTSEHNFSALLVFLVIYSVEFLLKIIAHGVIFQPYSYFRKFWNWFDFLVIIGGFIYLATGYWKGLCIFKIFRLIRIGMRFKSCFSFMIWGMMHGVKNLRDLFTFLVGSVVFYANFGVLVRHA